VLSLEKVPADSIDRWLLEQLAQPGGGADPLLPRPRIADRTSLKLPQSALLVLLRELLAEAPRNGK
ncbi:unnamed protein product, partial [Effrenium voratum]